MINPTTILVIACIVFFLITVWVLFNIISLSRQFKQTETRIGNMIKSSVEPHFVDASADAKDAIALAENIWRTEKRVEDLNLDPKKAKGLSNSLKKVKRYLDSVDIEIIDRSGEKFNEGLNIDVVHVEEDPDTDFAYIKEVTEPTIKCSGKVKKPGKAIVAKPN